MLFRAGERDGGGLVELNFGGGGESKFGWAREEGNLLSWGIFLGRGEGMSKFLAGGLDSSPHPPQ